MKSPCLSRQHPGTWQNMVEFSLPPKGSLSPNGPNDPHAYYYMPLIGRLFTARINLGLRLLQGLPRPHRALEVGYGSGLMMPTLCRLADQVCGLDRDSGPAEVSVTLARLGIHPQRLCQ